MLTTSLPSDIAQLSVAQRILLVEQIWDSIAAEEPAASLTKEQQQELERRILAHQASPDDVVPWDAISAEHRAKQ